VPPGGKKQNRRAPNEKEEVEVKSEPSEASEGDYEDLFVDYSLSPFVNMSTIKR